MGKAPTQKELIIKYIRKHGSITPMEAYHELGITKLSTRVSEMKSRGEYDFRIVIERGTSRYGKKTIYARYYLKEQEDGREKNVCEDNN